MSWLYSTGSKACAVLSLVCLAVGSQPGGLTYLTAAVALVLLSGFLLLASQLERIIDALKRSQADRR